MLAPLLALLLLVVPQHTMLARPTNHMPVTPLAHPMPLIILAPLPLVLLLVVPQLTMLAIPLAHPMPVIILGVLLLLEVGVVGVQPTRLVLLILAVSTQALLTTPAHIRWRHCLLYLPAVLHDFH